MKKLIFALVTVLSCTLFAVADDYSCRVYGTDNVASVIQTSAVAFRSPAHGNSITLGIRVALTKPAQEETTIVVNVKDGHTIVGTAHVLIAKGSKTPNSTGCFTYYNSSLEEGKSYNLTIANASCQ